MYKFTVIFNLGHGVQISVEQEAGHYKQAIYEARKRLEYQFSITSSGRVERVIEPDDTIKHFGKENVNE